MLFMKENHKNIMNHCSNIYSDNQKTGESKDDIIKLSVSVFDIVTKQIDLLESY